MRNLQKAAQNLFGSTEYKDFRVIADELDLIETADLLLDVYNYRLLQENPHNNVPLPFLPVLDSIRLLAQGGNKLGRSYKIPEDKESSFDYVNPSLLTH